MRHVKAALIIGIIAASVVILLDVTGWLHTLDSLARDFVGRFAKISSDVPRGTRYLIVALIALLAAWTTVDIRRPFSKAAVACLAAILTATGSIVLALYGVFFPPAACIAAILISVLIGFGYGRSDAGARKRTLYRLFGSRLSPKSIERLVDADVPVQFPGAEQEGTVIVCEVHNQAELMQSLDPADYVHITNLYLHASSDFLVEAGGYLDECGGECLRVVFGAPLVSADHAVSASRATIQLMSRLEALNVEIDARWHARIDYRIGINTGSMIAATYRGGRLDTYGVAGQTVEFARRLCAACSVYGCRVLIGPETFRQAQNHFEARPIELLKKADNSRVELYEVLAPKNGLSPERERSRQHFWLGVVYFRERRWDQALEEFSKARITGIPDPVLDNYILRVQRSRRGEFDFTREQLLLSA